MKTRSQVFARYASLSIQSLLIAAQGACLTYWLFMGSKTGAPTFFMMLLFCVGLWQMLDAGVGALGGNKWRQYYFGAATLYLLVSSNLTGVIMWQPFFQTPEWVSDALMFVSLGALPFLMAVSFCYLSYMEINGKTMIT